MSIENKVDYIMNYMYYNDILLPDKYKKLSYNDKFLKLYEDELKAIIEKKEEPIKRTIKEKDEPKKKLSQYKALENGNMRTEYKEENIMKGRSDLKKKGEKYEVETELNVRKGLEPKVKLALMKSIITELNNNFDDYEFFYKKKN
jgi:hypothetical protein